MRKLLKHLVRVSLIAALCTIPANAQNDQINTFPAMTAVGTTPNLDVVPTWTKYGQNLFTPSLNIVQAFVTGAPTACSFQLFGSLKPAASALFPDDFFQMTAPETCIGNGLSAVASAGRPVLTIVVQLLALSGGTNPSVSFIYQGKQ